MVAVAITHNPSSIEAALEQAFGLLPLEDLVHDRLVAVTPNETWASAADAVHRADSKSPCAAARQ
jgi:hypothetical protein